MWKEIKIVSIGISFFIIILYPIYILLFDWIIEFEILTLNDIAKAQPCLTINNVGGWCVPPIG